MIPKLHFNAIAPLICAFVAMVLSFLCVFAGHEPGFMPDYSLITLNTSQFAQVLDPSDLTDNSNVFEDFVEDAAESVSSFVEDSIADLVHESGLLDFYSAHILNYCSGTYTPTSAADDSADDSDLGQAVLFCSEEDALYHFDPLESLKQSLRTSGVGDRLTAEVVDALPETLDDAITAFRTSYRAIFVLYCMGITLAFLSMLMSAAGLLVDKRPLILANAVVASVAFFSLGIASAVVTAVIVQGTDAVNKFGNEVGIEAQQGNKFLGITWAATLLMMVAFLIWFVRFYLLKRQLSKMG